MRGTEGPERVVLAVAVVLVAVAVAPTAGAAASGGAAPGAVPETVAGTQLDPDSVLLRVTVHANGSATWVVEYRVRFDDESAREAFAAVEADVTADPGGFVAPFRERMTATAASAERATGREMDVRDVRATATREAVPQPHGVVRYRFAWRGFAAVVGDRVAVGDALSGLVLDEETTLLVSWPETHAASEVAPAPTDGTREHAAVWSGPLAFDADEPSLILTTGGPLPVPVPALGAAVVAALLGGVLWYRRRGRQPGGESVDARASGTPDAQAVERDPDLFSNGERVVALLRERGGRARQQDVVEAMEWTEAKTSRVVADLRESGAVEVFRLGRENVVSLPEEDDDA